MKTSLTLIIFCTVLVGCSSIGQKLIKEKDIHKIEFTSYYHCISGRGVKAEDCTKQRPEILTEESVEAYLKSFEPGGLGESFGLENTDHREKLRNYVRYADAQSNRDAKDNAKRWSSYDECVIYAQKMVNEDSYTLADGSEMTKEKAEDLCTDKSEEADKFYSLLNSILDKYDEVK